MFMRAVTRFPGAGKGHFLRTQANMLHTRGATYRFGDRWIVRNQGIGALTLANWWPVSLLSLLQCPAVYKHPSHPSRPHPLYSGRRILTTVLTLLFLLDIVSTRHRFCSSSLVNAIPTRFTRHPSHFHHASSKEC